MISNTIPDQKRMLCSLRAVIKESNLEDMKGKSVAPKAQVEYSSPAARKRLNDDILLEAPSPLTEQSSLFTPHDYEEEDEANQNNVCLEQLKKDSLNDAEKEAFARGESNSASKNSALNFLNKAKHKIDLKINSLETNESLMDYINFLTCVK